MSEIVYLNGRWVEKANATVSVEDRGFLFADGVYEVVRYYGGCPLAMTDHVERLQHSLAEIRLDLPDDLPPLAELSDELIRRNNLGEAAAYWQITRGVAPRHHNFPPGDTGPTILMMAYPARPLNPHGPAHTLKAITRPDTRWHRCSIKSICLLPNVLDSQAAADAGCEEAILVRDGLVTEGTHRSILIVDDRVLKTYPLDGRILDSITRRIVLDLARRNDLAVREAPFEVEDLLRADEVIAVGSTTEVAAVTQVDNRTIGHGRAGELTLHLLELYRRHVINHCRLQVERA